MIPILLALQALTLAALVALWLRKPSTSAAEPDPRLAQLLTADLPGQFTRLDARFDGLDNHLRAELALQRTDAASTATRSQEADAIAAAALRTEVLTSISTLSTTLATGLETFRDDNSKSAERLRLAVDAQLRTLTDKLTNFTADSARTHAENRETLHTRLNDLSAAQAADQEKLRDVVQQRLDKLNVDNAAKLEEMRVTVDEKLNATLHTRLTESFGQVTDQLTKVHTGLGEMTKLSAGVDDLSRIFTNVKTRGTIGEVMLENLLKQMLAPNQYEKDVHVKPGSRDVVEFAVKLPTPSGDTWLPIDSKFPREIWEHLETAYETGVDIESAGKIFEAAIRKEGATICEKYIAAPHTTSFAIMFLPTEGLYAEVMRRDGLQSDIQQNCHVTIAGPSTLSAILNSFQMGFHMLQLQQKGGEVWKVLASARTEFGKFEDLMSKMDNQVGTVQKTIQQLGTRTRAINRTLRDVSIDDPAVLAATTQAGFDGLLPMLAASDDE
jgi:DNA recombination protein RmuC